MAVTALNFAAMGLLVVLMAGGTARSQQNQPQEQSPAQTQNQAQNQAQTATQAGTQAQQKANPGQVQQKQEQKPDISVDVKLVNVFATVRDKKGMIVRNLTKNDFTLEEDGRPQTIQYFTQESDLPLTLGLLVDTSMSQRTVLSQERTASYAFLDHMLRERIGTKRS